MIELLVGLLLGIVLGLITGFVLGVWAYGQVVKDDFNGEYDRAAYEWKLNKEKRNDTSHSKVQ